ncbi:hypothetical protein SAMN05444141_101541 [Pseudovibrio denitrificans]|uniref:Uncharacterized protein n=1 Tax=Pseudovibrio denitrificans TaxID=258256 RepID=A0A1I6XZ76_9HYPH|nr:hypothetical protein SAMN05444141_101541 [Pseudovibrio denitrificans]
MTSEKRIIWRPTWPDQPNDEAGRDPLNDICQLRVHQDRCPEGRMVWLWAANFTTLAIAHGSSDTIEEAKASAEEAYFDRLQSGPLPKIGGGWRP